MLDNSLLRATWGNIRWFWIQAHDEDMFRFPFRINPSLLQIDKIVNNRKIGGNEWAASFQLFVDMCSSI